MIRYIKLLYSYFFLPNNKTAPPTTITPIPINGDQLAVCSLSAVISTLPISITFSLVT